MGRWMGARAKSLAEGDLSRLESERDKAHACLVKKTEKIKSENIRQRHSPSSRTCAINSDHVHGTDSRSPK